MNLLDATAEVTFMKPYAPMKNLTQALRETIRRQLHEIGRMRRLKRYISPQIAEAILLASRLCEQAKGGQILTNQKTFSEIESLVDAEPIGELNLKGFARAVSTFNVTGLRRRQSNN